MFINILTKYFKKLNEKDLKTLSIKSNLIRKKIEKIDREMKKIK